MGKTKVERHMDICKALNRIYEMKNKDYGDSFHETFLEEGFAMARIRLSDKLNRFKTLSRKGGASDVKNESMKDTLLDLANYAIMTAMEMDIRDENAAKGLKNVNKPETDEIPRSFANAIAPSRECTFCRCDMSYDVVANTWTCPRCGVVIADKANRNVEL